MSCAETDGPVRRRSPATATVESPPGSRGAGPRGRECPFRHLRSRRSVRPLGATRPPTVPCGGRSGRRGPSLRNTRAFRGRRPERIELRSPAQRALAKPACYLVVRSMPLDIGAGLHSSTARLSSGRRGCRCRERQATRRGRSAGCLLLLSAKRCGDNGGLRTPVVQLFRGHLLRGHHGGRHHKDTKVASRDLLLN